MPKSPTHAQVLADIYRQEARYGYQTQPRRAATRQLVSLASTVDDQSKRIAELEEFTEEQGKDIAKLQRESHTHLHNPVTGVKEVVRVSSASPYGYASFSIPTHTPITEAVENALKLIGKSTVGPQILWGYGEGGKALSNGTHEDGGFLDLRGTQATLTQVDPFVPEPARVIVHGLETYTIIHVREGVWEVDRDALDLTERLEGLFDGGDYDDLLATSGPLSVWEALGWQTFPIPEEGVYIPTRVPFPGSIRDLLFWVFKDGVAYWAISLEGAETLATDSQKGMGYVSRYDYRNQGENSERRTHPFWVNLGGALRFYKPLSEYVPEDESEDEPEEVPDWERELLAAGDEEPQDMENPDNPHGEWVNALDPMDESDRSPRVVDGVEWQYYGSDEHRGGGPGWNFAVDPHGPNWALITVARLIGKVEFA